MYELFNASETYVLPSGKSVFGKDLESSFPGCSGSVVYGAVVADGILSEMTRLSVLRDAYGVYTDDAAQAITEINAAKEEKRRLDIQMALDREIEHNAVGELGVMTATGFDSTAELGTMAATSMQSTAELGTTVAALEARIAALEAAKA